MRTRLTLPLPLGSTDPDMLDAEKAILKQLGPGTTLTMGDVPGLSKLPERPTLLDFYRARITGLTARHQLISAKTALDKGLPEKVIMAILVHDIAIGCLIRTDHGYWGAQMIAPYVDEEVAFAVQYHQPLRYFADEAAGYAYPDSYNRMFGPDYQPPAYIQRDADYARDHRWYMSARQVTMYDTYGFDPDVAPPDPAMFEDIIGRHFRQPEEGLGFDSSPAAHMWRTVMWPHNAL